MPRNGIRIGEVAARGGVSVDAVRYYEKRGLLAAAQRSESGYRLFAIEAIDRLLFIRQAQETGFSLDEIHLLLAGGPESCKQTHDLLQTKLEQVNERIKKLQAFKRTLGRHLQTCEDELAKSESAANCPVVSEIGRAARRR